MTSQIILNFAALSNNLSIDGVKPYSFALASSERSKILFSVNLVFRDQNGFGDYRLDTPFIGSAGL